MSTVISFSKNYDINIEQRVYIMRIVFGKVLLKKKGEKIMTKRFGFTLAEVLITLGIIGVVAAMTMPTLMNQTNGAQYKAAYKKALSAISQGVTLNVALDGGSFADTTTASAGKTDVADSVAKLLNDRMNIVKVSGTAGYTIPNNGVVSYECDKESDGTTLEAGCTAGSVTPDTYLFFNDGSMFAFDSNATACTKGIEGGTAKVCHGYIDVNGAKGPNKVVSDASHPTDIYPVKFYDQTILPASAAAKAVLYDGSTTSSNTPATNTQTQAGNEGAGS